MRTLELDNNSDLVIRNYSLQIVDGMDAIRQSVQSRLRLFLGEWFLDTRRGVDYHGLILIKQPNRATVESTLKREILSAPGVESLESFELQDSEDEERTLIVRFVARVDGNAVPMEVNL
jgi:hypothetical protein